MTFNGQQGFVGVGFGVGFFLLGFFTVLQAIPFIMQKWQLENYCPDKAYFEKWAAVSMEDKLF